MGGIARTKGRAQRQANPLTAEALAAVRATATGRRFLGGAGKRQESQAKAERRGRMDLALLSVLRDGLLRRSEAAELRWKDVEFRDDGAALLRIPQSKTDQEAKGTGLYIGCAAADALQAITPAGETPDPIHRSSDYPPSRSAGESTLQRRPPAWAKGSQATADGWAWPFTTSTATLALKAGLCSSVLWTFPAPPSWQQPLPSA